MKQEIDMSTGAATETPETFTALNGLRFMAALAVVFYHYAPKMDGFAAFPGWVKTLIHSGPAAVGFFFILSGFVLANRYLRVSLIKDTVASFYRARFARLYPAYMLAFVLFVPIALGKYLPHRPSGVGEGIAIFLLSAILYCLMLQAWTPLAQAWNGPSWSLSVEAFMYLIFPLVGPRLMRLSTRNALLVLGAGWMIPAALACASVTGLISTSTWRMYLGNNPLLWTPLFLTGICGVRFLPAWRQVSDGKASAISIGALVAVIVLAVVWPSGWSDVFVTGGIAPLLLAVIVFFSRTSGWITSTIGGEIFNKLGKASYALYIMQAPLWHYWQAFTNFIRPLPSGVSLVSQWQFWLFVPMLVLASVAVQHFIETPVHIWLLKKAKAKAENRTHTRGSIASIEQSVVEPVVADVA